ncbi:hypothetical protein [Bradyrhizobium algeriense]|uniref:hypothetical protein n=1 Tax=Bradyrhizobium algeriense TaxID=634784 RepID=UPI00167C65CD|nr:hypothetical protein [Bradyrhizobium algeriense]
MTRRNAGRNDETRHWRAGQEMICLIIRASERSQRVAVVQNARPAADVHVNNLAVDGEPDRFAFASDSKDAANVALLGEHDWANHFVTQEKAIALLAT